MAAMRLSRASPSPPWRLPQSAGCCIALTAGALLKIAPARRDQVLRYTGGKGGGWFLRARSSGTAAEAASSRKLTSQT